MTHQQDTSGCPEGSDSPSRRDATGDQLRLQRVALRGTYSPAGIPTINRHKASSPSSKACLCTVTRSLFLSTRDTISWRSFMNRTRDCRSAARGPRGRCGGQVSAEIWSSSPKGVEKAENIVQRSGVSRSTLLFYPLDHGRSWGRISFPSRARTIWWWLTTIPGSWKLPDFTL